MFVPQIMKCLRDRYSFYFEMTVFTFRYSLRLLLLTKLLKLVCVHQFIFFVGFKIELEFFWLMVTRHVLNFIPVTKFYKDATIMRLTH